MNLPKLNRNNGKKPTLHIKARTIPEAWEKALVAVWDYGVDIETDYDVKGAKEPPSREAAVLVEITEPFGEPRIHRNIPEGLEGLQKYEMEVRYGIHDHWVKIEKEGGGTIWDYSYHERLFAYPDFDKDGTPVKINQIEDLIQKLIRERHITKSAQAITWLPRSDHHAGHSPCLQRIDCRLIPNEEGILTLGMDDTWRSRDCKNAWTENVDTMTLLQKDIADELSRRLGEKVLVGNYIDFSDSLHIYGRDFNPNKILSEGVTAYEKFLDLIEKIKREPIENRIWRSDNPMVKEIMEEEKVRLLADPDYTRKGGDKAKPNLIKKDEKILGVVLPPNGVVLTYQPGESKLNEIGDKLLYIDKTIYKPELLY